MKQIGLLLAIAMTGCSEVAAPPSPHQSHAPPVAVASSKPAPALTPPERGMSVLVYGVPDPHWDDLFSRLSGDGVNAVALTFQFRQPTPTASRVEVEPPTPSVATLRAVIRAARKQGMSVALRPLMDQANMTGWMWRGAVWPTVPRQWFASYTAFLTPYLDLAQAEGVGAFVLGSELNGLEHYPALWQELISTARKHFHGQLGMAYNWDYFPPEVVAPLAVDFFGVDAYFPLAAGASQDELAAAWQPWLAKMEAAAQGKPIEIMEIGSAPVERGWEKPWLGGGGKPVDPFAQVLYYRATCAALKDHVQGIYWWFVDVFSPHTDGLRSFDPLGKPAEEALSACYGK